MSATWSEREALAEQLVPLVGQLHRNNKVVTTVFGRSLVHKSVTDIIKVHPVSYTHLTLPTTCTRCRSRWSTYH